MVFAIELENITKRFGHFVANAQINLGVRAGEIHAIIGENGAGKTTLMNILFGLSAPDEGAISIHGKKVEVTNPATAIAHGLGMVHQHFKLVPSLSVAENVFLGMEIRRRGLIDTQAQIEQTQELAQKFGLALDARARVGDLSVGVQQRIEILKTLARQANILILDEPTAVLTPQESRELFKTLRLFVAQGMTILFISHYLEEVMAVCDRITVLRDGRVVATRPREQFSGRELVQMMVGRDVNFSRSPRRENQGAPVLEVRNLKARDDRQLPALKSVDFDVCRGEIVGIAGIAGNGQAELAEVLAGLRRASAGHIKLQGEEITSLSAAQIRHLGLAHVPGDRLARGVDPHATLSENMLMGRTKNPNFIKMGFINWTKIHQETQNLIEQFDIRARSPKQPVRTLSGGNMQKLILARELSHDAALLLIDQPSRGVDIGAQEAIHDEILRRRECGQAILLISTQLDELEKLADRVLVMFDGSIMGQVAGQNMDKEAVGLMMTGGKHFPKSGSRFSGKECERRGEQSETKTAPSVMHKEGNHAYS